MPDQPASVLTGLVRCADCGTKMHVRRNTQKRQSGKVSQYNYFGCGSYRKSGATACSPHSVREEMLVELVLADIRSKAQAVTVNEKEIAAQIIRMKNTESDTRLAGYEKELKAALARLPEIERLMMNLYEDRIKGSLPETVFATLIKKYETQQTELNAQIPLLGEKINGNRQNVDNTARWIEHIKKYFNIQAADASILVELLDHIEVGEPHKENGVTVCDVKVIYRYVGDIDCAVESAMKEAAA